MALLAIKGHATRGNEVIEILEMMGGNNRENCWGVFENRLYLINAFGDIEDMSLRDNSNYQLYTLEEFLEKFPYKTGDDVIVEGKECFITDVIWCNELNCIRYKVFHTTGSLTNGWYYVCNLQPFKEETMKDNNLYDKLDFTQEPSADKVELILGDYEIKEEDGKTYLIKKQSKYPKTYEGCCKVLSLGENG